jgi:hypothetical protein
MRLICKWRNSDPSPGRLTRSGPSGSYLRERVPAKLGSTEADRGRGIRRGYRRGTTRGMLRRPSRSVSE